MRFLRVIRAFENWPAHYLNAYGLIGRPRVELRTRGGVKLRVRSYTSDFRTSRSVVADESYFYGGPPLSRGAVVVDIGAHMGTFSCLAASMARDGRVLSYEPEPSNFALLEENLALNGFAHARAFNRAVAGEAGARALHLSLKPTTTGGHSLHRNGERSISVECTTLDAIVEENGLDRIDFLKLDCEGAELEILQAASPATRAKLRRGAIELHHADHREPLMEIVRGAGLIPYDAPKPNYLFFRGGEIRAVGTAD